MQRAFNYYIGLTLATWILLWVSHFAVEPRINLNNVYTREAIVITFVLVFNTVFLLLNRFYKNRILRVGSILLLIVTLALYFYLIVDLIKAKSHLYNLPFYVTYIYCFILSGMLIRKGLTNPQ
jgi:uncharacterized membrane protein YagU involved in acid resistance